MPIAQLSETGTNIRLDAEYFAEENEVLMSQLKQHELIPLGVCALYIKDMGKFSLYKSEFLRDEGIPFLRATNIKNNFIDFSDTVFIDEAYHKKLKNSQLEPNDILLSTKGVIGLSACFSSEIGRCNMSQNLVRIAVDLSIFNPYFVSAFLNSKFGKFQTKRLASGNMQPYLNFENIRQLLIPKLPLEFQNEIEYQIKQHGKMKKEAEIYFSEAENILLTVLKLGNILNYSNTSVRSLSESFVKTNRLDAEFYNEKFNIIENNIKNYSNGFDILEKLVEIKDQNFLPEKEKKYKYIELAKLNKYGTINDVKEYSGKKLVNRAKRKTKSGDVIISSISGSLNKCAIIPIELNESICSTAFFVVRSSEINSETILTFFKNNILQNLMKKACSGSILISANRQDFGKIIFPKIKQETQEKIAKTIRKSINLQNKAKETLLRVNKIIENKITD